MTGDYTEHLYVSKKWTNIHNYKLLRLTKEEIENLKINHKKLEH